MQNAQEIDQVLINKYERHYPKSLLASYRHHECVLFCIYSNNEEVIF